MGISLTADEHDGNVNAGVDQFTLDIQPAHPRKSHIQNQATRIIWGFSSQKLLRRSKGLGVQTYRLQQTLHRCTHTSVIINNEHNGFIGGAHACAALCCGTVN
jgi:hypothetical protein